MANVGTLSVAIAANTKKFVSGMNHARKQLKLFGQSANRVAGMVGGLAAALGAGVSVSAFRRAASDLDRLAKTSAKLGIATERLGGLQYAASQTGVETNKLNMALQRMTRRVAEAAGGSGEAVNALRELGLNAGELNRLSPDQVFSRVATAMQGVSSQSDKVRLAFKLFDSEGVDLVNTLSLGADGLKRMQREARQLGIVFSGEELARVEAFNDSLDRLQRVTGSLGQRIVIDMAPGVEHVVSGLAEAVDGLRNLRGDSTTRSERARRNAPVTAGGLVSEDSLRNGWQTQLWRRAFDDGDRRGQLSASEREAAARRMRESMARTEEQDERRFQGSFAREATNRSLKKQGESIGRMLAGMVNGRQAAMNGIVGRGARLVGAGASAVGAQVAEQNRRQAIAERNASIDQVLSARTRGSVDTFAASRRNLRANVGDVQERTAKAAEKTVETMKDLRRAWRDLIDDGAKLLPAKLGAFADAAG